MSAADHAPDPIGGFAELAGAELARQGFPRAPARVLMALTAADDGALTAAELRESLGLSAAAVSQATGYLEQVGFLRTTTVPGSRRHRYSLTTDHWYAGTHRTLAYARSAEAVTTAADLLPPSSPGRLRAEEMADFFLFCAERVPQLLETWRAEREAGTR